MDRSEKTIIFVLLATISMCGFFFFVVHFITRSIPTANATALDGEFSSTSTPALPTPVVNGSSTAVSSQGDDAKAMLDILQTVEIPPADLIGLAEKFTGKIATPAQLTSQPKSYQVGDQMDFWVVSPDDTNEKIKATLGFKTDSIYFWVENGISYLPEDLKSVAETFSSQIYLKNQEFFGKEWIPGVDNDPHLFILFASGLGDEIAGYTSFIDSVLPVVHPYSNAHEMVTINTDTQPLGDPYTLSVMAHEYQHLIHQYQDPNEELWLNEGFSELSTLINGYETGGFDRIFIRNPDLQLNDWANGDENSIPHYGASFLFTTYLMGRFGSQATQAIVASSENGLESIDSVFNDLGIRDSLTHEIYTADHLFADWAVANYLMDDSIEDGRFDYQMYPNSPRASPTEIISSCENSQAERTVNQYGTDYIEITCGHAATFTFSGDKTVPVIPVESKDGSAFMWSNSADSSDTTMTREFDFSKVTGTINLQFDLWYSLEENYDFGYLMYSENGEDWRFLNVPGCTIENTTGNNYGCGINGESNGWKNINMDVSQFAGKKIALRFEMITDGAVLGDGFAVDDFSISAINEYDTFNNDEGGWDLKGFIRLANEIPQTFLVSVIDQGQMTTVSEFSIKPGERLEIPIRKTSQIHPVTIVISGSTRFTHQPAAYSFSINAGQ